MTLRMTAGGESTLAAAGSLLAVEAIDPSGLLVTSEGAFVRVLRVSPVNPVLMSAGERERIAAALQRRVSVLPCKLTIGV